MFAKFSQRPAFYGRRTTLEQLEERIVLDAATAAASDQADQSSEQWAARANPGAAETTPSPEPQPDASDSSAGMDPLDKVFGQDLSVVLISNFVENVEAFHDAADKDAQVVVYDFFKDNLSSIVDQLSTITEDAGRPIDHLGVVSDGTEGELMLSLGEMVTVNTVDSSADSWLALGSLLSDDAQIDLYGCSLAGNAQGSILVEKIATYTGATVLASDDGTGNYRGADWDLEVKSGNADRGPLINTGRLEGLDIYLDVIIGTAGGDSLEGTPGNDLILGLGGSDTINGNGGSDIIFGDWPASASQSDPYTGTGSPWTYDASLWAGHTAGNDVIIVSGIGATVYGGEGDDVLYALGSASGNTLNGEEGDDNLRVLEEAHDNTLDGGRGADRLYAQGTASGNELNGDDGYDCLYAKGSASGNTLNGGNDGDHLEALESASGNTLNGGAGRDHLYAYGTASGNTLNGGDDHDEMGLSGSVSGNTLMGDGGDDTLRIINEAHDNTLAGGDGNDYLIGEDVDFCYPCTGDGNIFKGGAGNDTLVGTLGDDIMFGHDGTWDGVNGIATGDASYTDLLYGYSGDDHLFTAGSGDRLNGGDGNDRLYAQETATGNTLNGNMGIDHLYAQGTASGNELNGDDGYDCLYAKGSASGNTLNGGNDSDHLEALESASGNTLNGGAGRDHLYAYGTASGNTLNGGDDHDEMGLSGSVSGNTLMGDGGDDTLRIINEAHDNTLAGGDGNDYLIGEDVDFCYPCTGDGNIFKGGAGNDTLVGTLGDDIMFGHDGTWDGVNVIATGDASYTDLLYGYSGDDHLFTAGSGDRLDGGRGSDFLRVQASATAYSLIAGDGDDSITNEGSVNGPIDAGKGDDIVANYGTAASIWGGSGDDVIRNLGSVTGAIYGDTGDDSVIIGVNGTVGSTMFGGDHVSGDTLTVCFTESGDVTTFSGKDPNNDSMTDSTGRTLSWVEFEGHMGRLNISPELEGITYSIGSMDEDSALVYDIADFAARITEHDADQDKGIAIFATVGNGTWEYSTDGGSSWNTVGSVGADYALLLSAETSDNNRIRYTGDTENGETASIAFHAWDHTDAKSPGDYADPTPYDASGSFSEKTDTATITVTDSNDPPSANPDLVNTNEDTGVDFDVPANDTDVDHGDTKTYIGKDTTGMTHPSNLTDNLDGTFVYDPRGDFDDLNHGDIATESFTYTMCDASGLESSATVTITITGVNDAPEVEGVTHALDPSSMTEDDTQAFAVADFASYITDPDSDPLKGVAITGGVGNGTWEFSLDAGASWTNFGSLSTSSALLLSAEAADGHWIRYTGDGIDGETASITYRAWDQTVAAGADQHGDASSFSDTGAFSGETNSACVTVIAVNDAPEVSVPADFSMVGSATFAIAGISINDVDAHEGELRVTLSVSHGTLTLGDGTAVSIDGGADGSGGMTFTGTLGQINTALDTLSYAPFAGYLGSDQLDIEVNDQGHSGDTGLLPGTLPGTASVFLGALTDSASIAITIVARPIHLVPVDDTSWGSDDYGTSGDRMGSEPLFTFDGFSTRFPEAFGSFEWTNDTALGFKTLFSYLVETGLAPLDLVQPQSGSGLPLPNDHGFIGFAEYLAFAIFADTDVAREEAWNALYGFLAAWKNENREVPLALMEFLDRFQEFQYGKTLEQIILVFNADLIQLAERLIGPESEISGQGLADTGDGSNSPQARLLHGDGIAFDLNAVSISDILHDQVESAGTEIAWGPEARSALWDGLSKGKVLTFDLKGVTAADHFLSEARYTPFDGMSGARTRADEPFTRVFDLDEVSVLDALAS